MNTGRQIALGAAVICSLYCVLPLALFDFTEVAVPRDEESFGNQHVGLGPLPRPWFARFTAADLDIPGGYGYDADGWAFVVWKPLCILCLKSRGYALPAEWR